MKKLLLSVSLVGLGVMGFAQDEMKKVEKEAVEVVAQPDGSIVIEGDNKEESVSLNGEKLIVKGNNIVVHGVDRFGNRTGEPDVNVSKNSGVQKIDS